VPCRKIFTDISQLQKAADTFRYLASIIYPKMKVSVILAILLAFSISVKAQDLNFKVKWGKEFKASGRSSLNNIVGHDGTGIYVVRERYRSALAGGNDYTLEHYDNNLLSTKSFDLDIREDGNRCQIDYILYLHSRLFLFYSMAEQKSKKNLLFVREVDKSTLQPKADREKIGEIDYAGKSKRNSGDFFFRVSRDSSKIMVVYSLPYDDDEPEAFGLSVLDENLNSLWKKDISIPYSDKLFDIESFRVDNEGNAYLLGLAYKDKRKSKRRGLPNYNYEVFAFREKGTAMKQYHIQLEDRFLSDMQIEILDNRNLVCAGFYSEKGTFSVRGTYFLVVDAATTEIKTKSFKEFGMDFITQNMSEREARKAARREEKGEEMELYEYDLDKLLLGKDGSAMLVGEQYFVRSVTSTSMINGMMSTRTTYHYYYNDIITVKVNSSGQIQWAQKVPKSQHTINDGGFYSSYTMAIVKGKICFLFNDSPKNLEEEVKGRPANYNARKSVVVMVSLDQNGNSTKQPIFNAVDAEVIMRPKVCEQIANKEIILFGQRKKNQQFARLMFE
jgi:hypothetical protein